MSIWCSRGYDEIDGQRGTVVAYADGWSSHYPAADDPPATVDLAVVPAWCVPGQPEDRDGIGPWLRIGIASPFALSWWDRIDGKPRPAPVYADVVMDEAAVLALYHDLGDWLMQSKVRPSVTP